MADQNFDFAQIGGSGDWVPTSEISLGTSSYIPRNPSAPVPEPKRSFSTVQSEENRKLYGSWLSGLNAYSRHKKFINDYVIYYGRSKKQKEKEIEQLSKYKADSDILKEQHRFIWAQDDKIKNWEQRMAKNYYDKLFKVYCLADLSRYKQDQIGFRWRIEKEVMEGKGQFVCGNIKCEANVGLTSYEVAFVYQEGGEEKQALVKCKLCEKCAYKLNYKKNKEKEKEEKKQKHREKKQLKLEAKKRMRNEIEIESDERVSKQPKVHDKSNDEMKAENVRVDSPKKQKAPLEGSSEKQGGTEEKQEANVWAQRAEKKRSREDEFDEFFADMFT